MTSSATPDAIASLRTALDLAKATFGLADPNQYRVKAVELQQAILTAQESALREREAKTALVQRVRELEAEVAEFKAQKRENERYQLKDYGGGTYAYELKAEEARGEPPHRLCAACYQKGHKSILQFTGNSLGRDHLDCPACKTNFTFGLRREPRQRGPVRTDFF